MNELTLPNAGGQIATEQARAVAEVQAAILIAQARPRNEGRALERILATCSRVTLAESAVYSFPRGGQEVTGPSIRLAETLARNWGNIQCGVRELEQSGNQSLMEAFAHDLETNYRVTKQFTVAHTRKAKGSIQALSDPRDIYELAANQGSRRLRACILAVIPVDIVEEALRQCELTLQSHSVCDEKSVSEMLSAFSRFNVSPKQIEAYLGKSAQALNTTDMARLKKVFAGLRDGMAKAEDIFPTPPSHAAEVNQALASEQKPEKAQAKPRAGGKDK